MAPHSRRPAFTLVELVVVLAIIALLLGLIFSAIQLVRDSANRTACTNHLKQIGLALHHYHDVHGVLPPGCRYRNGADPQPFMSWQTRLLPHLEQEALWRQALAPFAQDKFFESPPHLSILGRVMPLFTCPSDSRTLSPWDFGAFQVAFTAYLGVAGTDREELDGLFFLDSKVRFADVLDGTSQTLAVGERPPSADHRFGWWYAGWGQRKDGSADLVLGVSELNVALGYRDCPRGPYAFGPGKLENKCDTFHFWSRHRGGANFLFADSSVHFLPYSAAPSCPPWPRATAAKPSKCRSNSAGDLHTPNGG